MKKLLTAAIIVMLMACICIGGALFVQAQEGSEESAQHVHVWTYDNNVATCSAQGCPITDATCSAHTADTSKWMHVTEESDTYHYRVCEICEIEIAESKAKCEGGTATCQKGPICTECTTEYGAAVADAHTWVNSECTEDGCDATCDHNGTLSTSNVSAGQHKTECSVCDYELTENCTGGAATCQKGPICTACTTEYGEAVADAHTWVNSECTEDGCGATCDHNGTLSTSNVSAGQHKTECSVCDYELTENCTGGAATCQKGPICTECTTEYGEAVADAHTWVNSECTEDGCGATCDHNGTLSTSNVSAGQHKTECSVCDYELTENCTGGAATCQKGPICTACTTEYGEAVADAHTWVNSACTVENCGATCDHNGTLSTSNVSDGQHKTECSVCDYELTENCTGGTATCTTRATCGECQQEYGPTPEGHKTGDLLQNTELDYHYRLCSVCEQELDVEYCYGGTATCTERAVCEVCENVYGELYHRKDTTLKQNFEEGYHYYSCIDCGAELDVEECHGGTAANCTMLPECAACGRPYGNEYGAHTEEPTLYGHPHDDPEQYHILYYACCDRTVDAEHVAGTAATCQIKSVCAVCGVQYGEKDNNNHVDLSCQPLNTTHHNIVCVCGVVVGTAAHNGGSATCSSQPKCADCGTAYGAYNDVHTYDNGCDAECNGCGETRTPAEHAFGEWQVTKNPTETEEGEQKRVCAVCGETQTATIAAITNPGGSGEPDADGVKTSTVVIIVAAVVVAAAAIGAIVILTKKKKKK